MSSHTLDKKGLEGHGPFSFCTDMPGSSHTPLGLYKMKGDFLDATPAHSLTTISEISELNTSRSEGRTTESWAIMAVTTTWRGERSFKGP